MIMIKRGLLIGILVLVLGMLVGCSDAPMDKNTPQTEDQTDVIEQVEADTGAEVEEIEELDEELNSMELNDFESDLADFEI